MKQLFFFYLIVFILANGLTFLIRRYALSTQLLDIPNDRSSHKQPTPRGGGVSFVLVFIFSIIYLYFHSLITAPVTMIMTIAALGVALLGFIDDRRGLAAKWRLLGHFLAAGFVIGVAYLYIPSIWMDNPYLNLIVGIISLFFIVWMLNLFNFMDGIDALASSEAVFVCLAMGLMYTLNGEWQLFYPVMCLAIAVAGFLYWNLPPAKIFMGDAGSGFLGFILAILALQAATANPIYFCCWLILLSAFIVDASFTLFQRALRGCRVWDAHCQHAYQHAARYYQSHRRVSFSVMIINIVWLLPLALLVLKGLINGWLAILIAWISLLVVAKKWEAGKE